MEEKITAAVLERERQTISLFIEFKDGVGLEALPFRFVSMRGPLKLYQQVTRSYITVDDG